MDAQIEYRNSKRISRISIVNIEEEPVGNIYFGLMHNESRHGMYFESMSGFQPGTVIKIKFDEPSPILNDGSCRGQVVWSKEINEKSFHGYGAGVQYWALDPINWTTWA